MALTGHPFLNRYKTLMFMRKVLVVLVALLLAVPASMCSQNVMVINFKNSDKVVDFAFKDKPVVSFTETEVVLKTADSLTFSYTLASLAKFSFVTKDLSDLESPTEIKDVKESNKVTFLIEGYSITINQVGADIPVRIFSADGRLQETYKTDKSGSVSFSIEKLPGGTYTVNSQAVNVKVRKK